MTRAVTLSVAATCDRCAQVLAINGPVRSVHCERCRSETHLTFLADDIVVAAKGHAPIGASYRTRTLRKPACSCHRCGALVPLGHELRWVGMVDVLRCPTCNAALPTYPAPDWLGAALSSALQIFGGDGTAAHANQVALPTAATHHTAAFQCPGCGAPLRIDELTSRSTRCGHCRADVFLPDSVWSQLHPPSVLFWTLTYVGRLVVRPH